MKRIGAVLVALWVGAAWAQVWEEVDGGFSAGRRANFLRTVEMFAPRAPNEAFVFRDSDDPATEVRIRYIDASGTAVDGSILPDAGPFQPLEQLTWGTHRLGYGPTGVGVQGSTPAQIEVTWNEGLTANFASGVPSPGLSLSRGGRTIWNLKTTAPLQPTDAGAAVSCTNCGFGLSVINAETIGRGDQLTGAGNETVVNAGGRVFSVGSAMWEWSAYTKGWRAIGAPPAIRNRPALAWDAERQRLVFFGGQTNATMFDDTWEWDGSSWQRIDTAMQPSPRMAHKMVFDPVRKRTVLFGGEGPSGVLGDTWEWDGTTWTQLSPATSPSARDAMGLAWDGTRNQVLLFGGYTSSAASNETWSWNGTVWEQLSPTTSPEARSSLTMTWDETRQTIVLAGALNTGITSTFEWNGTNWVQLGALDDAVSRPGLTHVAGFGTFLFSGDNAWQLVATDWVGPVRRYLGRPTFGTTSEDGGTVIFTNRDERLEWSDGWWHKASDLPFTGMISVARDGAGRLVALAERNGGVVTWVSENGQWTEKGSAPRGVLAADKDGTVHVFGQSLAARFSGTEWVRIPWPAGETARAAWPREEGGFWINQQNAFGFVADGQWQRLALAASGPLIVDQPDAPLLSVGNSPLQQWSRLKQREDGGASDWEQFSVGIASYTDEPLMAAGRTPSGSRVFVGEFTGVVYRPERSVSSRCDANSQCLSGVCVDGRCCDRACGTASCEVCSVERGASANGVCTPQPEEVCSPSEQVDAGVVDEMPQQPSGCGCASVDSLLAIAALIVLRRSMASQPRA